MAIFSHIFTAHQERPFMNFRLKLWHHHSIPWSRFSYRALYFGDTWTISDDFCIGYAECPPYFYFRCSWPTDLESVSREVDTTIRCLVIALLLLIRYATLWPWPFDFGQWSYMAGHVVNPSTKFEDPMSMRFWVMSSDISHRIPLTGKGRSIAGKISGGRGRPPTNVLIPRERQLNALQRCRWQFLYNETLQQTFRPWLSKLSKIRHL